MNDFVQTDGRGKADCNHVVDADADDSVVCLDVHLFFYKKIQEKVLVGKSNQKNANNFIKSQFLKEKSIKKLIFGKYFSKIFQNFAGIVQSVEHLLAKEDVARSSRVTRFFTKIKIFEILESICELF